MNHFLCVYIYWLIETHQTVVFSWQLHIFPPESGVRTGASAGLTPSLKTPLVSSLVKKRLRVGSKNIKAQKKEKDLGMCVFYVQVFLTVLIFTKTSHMPNRFVIYWELIIKVNSTSHLSHLVSKHQDDNDRYSARGFKMGFQKPMQLNPFGAQFVCVWPM